MMNHWSRTEHMQFCKKRALAYLPDNTREAVTSMLSDLGKHEETKKLQEVCGPIGLALLMEDAPPERIELFINGFAD